MAAVESALPVEIVEDARLKNKVTLRVPKGWKDKVLTQPLP